MKSPSARSGFTLIELLIVIGILALVLAMGTPSLLQTMKQDGLRRATSDVVEGCSLARAQAILRGETAEFVLRAADGRMSVRLPSSESPESRLAAPPKVTPPEGTPTEVGAYSRLLPEDVEVRMIDLNLRDQMGVDEVRVRFFANGTSDEFTLVLENDEGIRKIALECVTGLADVEVLR
jgi:prepilin-type N-terminal cleavage/methylation domain-containing protein